MAHKKGVGSSKNGRDSESNRLGVKIYGGQAAIAGNIIIRQRGTKYHPGEGVGLGKDHTIYATTDGVVMFRKRRNNRTYVSVLPSGEVVLETKAAAPAAKKAAPVKEAPVKEEAVAEAAAPAVEAAPEAEKKAAPKAKKAAKGDDLKKVEGIGPKIAQILAEAGIDTFEALSKKTADEVREILAEAGSRYASHNPETWPQQAAFAAEGKWDELKAWQDELNGGRA